MFRDGGLDCGIVEGVERFAPDRVVVGVFGWYWGVSGLEGGHCSSFSYYRFSGLSCGRGRELGPRRLFAP